MRSEEILLMAISHVVVCDYRCAGPGWGGFCPVGKGQDLGWLLVITENRANTDPTLTMDLFLGLFLISFQGLIYDPYLPLERDGNEAAGLLGQAGVLM